MTEVRVTREFIRWNCPRCETHNVLPVFEGRPPEGLRCDECKFAYDPLDDTHPRAEGWRETSELVERATT